MYEPVCAASFDRTLPEGALSMMSRSCSSSRVTNLVYRCNWRHPFQLGRSRMTLLAIEIRYSIPKSTTQRSEKIQSTLLTPYLPRSQQNKMRRYRESQAVHRCHIAHRFRVVMQSVLWTATWNLYEAKNPKRDEKTLDSTTQACAPSPVLFFIMDLLSI